GNAFRDFDPPELVQADREAARREGRTYLNIRRSLDLSPAQIEQFLAEGRPHVIRFLIPRDQTVAIDDLVRGHVRWDCGLMPDPVIMRADGSPLYNFATAVDDAHMRISHVIRAEEHLSNTPIQVLIHRALGHPIPQFAHVPYVAAPGSKEKLSKRKRDTYRNNPQFRKMLERGDLVFSRLGLADSERPDPVMVEYYERMGYLPEAVRNALVRLGWSLDEKTEILPLETVVESFTLDRIIKSPAGFDPDKLARFQAHWMSQLDLEQKTAGCLPFLIQAGYIAEEVDDETRRFVARLVRAMGDRLKVFSDILDYEEFFLDDEQLVYDEKVVEKRLRKPADARQLLRQFRERLATVEPFDAPTLDRLLHQFVEAKGVKIGHVIHALRVAVTGKSVGIGMFDCLELLGRERCLRRIDRALALAEASGRPERSAAE
ncbi:MAG TPA: glutamate--tRNA ligase, partial [Planctomycetaceae bacterium]|nr:glutamate--tRNA ligase [Planctomycetaceae bacterium]